jgi:hypothetical protein
MRYLFGFLCVCALGVMPLAGCSEVTGDGGTGGDGGTRGMPECQSPEDCEDDNECTDDTCLAGVCEFMGVDDAMGPEEPGDPPGEGTTCGYYLGTCEAGSCVGTFACTEAGIREASAAGAGPHNFDCDGPTTIVTEAEIVIEANSDVILEGNELTVDGDDDHRVFSVAPGATVELQGFTVTGGAAQGDMPIEDIGGGIRNAGTLALTDCTISENRAEGVGGGISNSGILTVRSSTISGNAAVYTAGGIFNGGTMNLTNSTISGNTADEAGGIVNTRGLDEGGVLTMTNCTLSGNTGGGSAFAGITTLTGTVVNDGCFGSSHDEMSNGYNVESPGNTCGFDQGTDQVNVSADDLKLGPLADKGGPTMTHALEAGSVAIDVIPEDDCVDAEGELLWTDQRGAARFVAVGPPFGAVEPVGDGCDVGAFEVQP